MLKIEIEKSLTWLLAIGTVVVTCFVWTGNVSDPVNAPKLLVLGTLAFGILGVLVKFGLGVLWSNFRMFLIFSFAFNFFMLTSTIFSNAPVIQSIYGAYGRNTGALTYFSLSVVSMGALLVGHYFSFIKLIRAMLLAGVINIIYCLWVLSFGDPIPWSNTYKNILGLFGNPNFISAFLGMTATAALGFALTQNTKLLFRLSYISLGVLSGFLIYKSHSIQGIFVALAGCSAVVYFFIRHKFKSAYIHFGYAVLVLMSGTLAIAGMLQHGPLSFIYKKSVSLRGSYWNAGLEMGQSHPFTGVGMDSYGDWYRSARPPVALIDTPGPTVLSNVAHNVVIDLFASGGYPLMLSYLGILLLGFKAIVNLILKQKKYDVVTVVLSTTWLGYQAQSIVSINQIGLAIWGWLLTGLLISYERFGISESVPKDIVKPSMLRAKRGTSSQVISPQLVIGVGFVIGILISVPPMSSDARWFAATQSRDLSKFKESLVGSYMNPINSPRLANAAVILQNSNLLSEAREYALKGIKFNPDYFESYLVLYGLPNASESEKAMAMKNMKRLDPKNPDVLKYK